MSTQYFLGHSLHGTMGYCADLHFLKVMALHLNTWEYTGRPPGFSGKSYRSDTEFLSVEYTSKFRTAGAFPGWVKNFMFISNEFLPLCRLSKFLAVAMYKVYGV
jgi:hypothetical protein